MSIRGRDEENGQAGEGLQKRVEVFATTRWSVVLAAGTESSPEATAALSSLCETYWYPLYAHLRRAGYSKADAEDHTQAFLVHLLERQAIQRVSPSKGRFRSFLLASLKYFLSDQHDRSMAQKRGGGQTILSFDAQAADERYKLEPTDGESPDKVFERRWALALLDQVLMRLRDEFKVAGKCEQFVRLSGYLVENKESGTYAEAARDLGQTEEAIKKAVQRMRARYRDLFREEIANTVAMPEDVEEELRHLRRVISSRRSG